MMSAFASAQHGERNHQSLTGGFLTSSLWLLSRFSLFSWPSVFPRIASRPGQASGLSYIFDFGFYSGLY